MGKTKNELADSFFSPPTTYRPRHSPSRFSRLCARISGVLDSANGERILGLSCARLKAPAAIGVEANLHATAVKVVCDLTRHLLFEVTE